MSSPVTKKSITRDTSKPLSTNVHLLNWVEKMANLTKPAAIHWVDGSVEEDEYLKAEMVANGTFIEAERRALAGLLLRAFAPKSMSRASKIAPTSARFRKTRPVRPTIGKSRLRCDAS